MGPSRGIQVASPDALLESWNPSMMGGTREAKDWREREETERKKWDDQN